MDKNGNSYRLLLHLMPPSGWLNDPNGLCFYQGKYHVFFQYAPGDAEGAKRYWGHYTSEDMNRWNYEGIALRSDTPWDKSGAYSGCAYVEDGRMELFYTGNVKKKGDYDYVLTGREANVITVSSSDGIHFSPKKLLLTNWDYPKDYTCHVRDPKVWSKDGLYYMILGGRKKSDEGAVLQYVSKDKVHWEFAGEIMSDKPFGYMWECPDAFELSGHTLLLCCPQGVEREEYRYQNMYPSGYFVLEHAVKENLAADICQSELFTEWDMGFDFYAPQTFEDEKGRRILYGWAGVPDMDDEYRNLPIVEEGWQHSLTLPRELTWKDGRVYQYPAEEINLLRYDEEQWENAETEAAEKEIVSPAFDLEVDFEADDSEKTIRFDEDVQISWQNGVVTLQFLSDSGCGRKERRAHLKALETLRVVKDTSMLEIYVNQGELVFTTRYFPEDVNRTCVRVKGSNAVRSWKLKQMEVCISDDAGNEQ